MKDNNQGNNQTRIEDTAKALRRLQEIGYIAAYQKTDKVEFPMPYNAKWFIEMSDIQNVLVINGTIGHLGKGTASVTIDFCEEEVVDIAKSFDLQLQGVAKDDYQEAERLTKSLLWLQMGVRSAR